MKIRSIVSLLILLPLIALTSCSERSQLPGKAFEGKIVQRITVNAGGLLSAMLSQHDSSAKPQAADAGGISASMLVTMYTKADKVAFDVSVFGLPIKAHTIVDRNARNVTELLPNKTAYVTDLRKFDDVRPNLKDTTGAGNDFMDSLQALVPKPTGAKKTINGLDCEEYKTSIAGTDLTLWITQDPRLKFYDVVRDALLGKSRTGLGGLEEVFAMLSPVMGEGHVPVVAEVTRGGQTIIKSELVEMSEQSVDDDVFAIPKDYTIQK